jgi:hypothetical protein
VTDDGSGIDPASASYQVRKQGAASPLLGWTTPDASRVITGGGEYDVYLTRAAIPALGTDQATFEVVIRGADRMGEPAEATQCFVNHPMGPPLRWANPKGGLSTGDPTPIQEAKIWNRTFAKDNLAPLINGVPASAGAGVMQFDVINPWDEPVYFELLPANLIGFSQPSASGTKAWKDSAVRTAVTAVNLNCLTNLSNCSKTWPSSEQTANQTINSVANVIGGSRVWDLAGGANQPVAACAGCGPNRYEIPARSGTTPRVFRVMLVTTDLSQLHPGQTDTGDFVEYSLQPYGDPTIYRLTGKLLGTFTRCTDETVIVDINGNITTHRCNERTTYQRYLALTGATLTIQGFSAMLTTSATGAGTAAALGSLPAPALTTTSDWPAPPASNSSEVTPPKAAGMP